MSYLHPPRLHFSGRFQASPSTVNNDPVHYDNDRFRPEFQLRQNGRGRDQWNGWWNPDGDGAWRLIGCRVTAALMPDGRPAGQDDPVLWCLVADSDRAVAAKIVDLDPEQQLASQIWGSRSGSATRSGRTSCAASSRRRRSWTSGTAPPSAAATPAPGRCGSRS
ncbi:MAG TPA: hypothetical protein VG406_17665 [Isosphaeraceae bacterium]|nr:hypothetical protein [Isosphaeraceae bacterium]